MGKLGEAVVEIRPDMAGLDRGLSQAEGKISGFVGSSKRLLAGLAVGSAIGMGASQIVDATVKAMDFGETLSKVGASFGTSGKVIEKTAQELADKFGPLGQGTRGIRADQPVALRLLNHATVAELGERGESDDAVNRALLAAQKQLAAQRRAAVSGIEEHVRIY